MGQPLVAVAPSRNQFGFDGSERKVTSAYEVLDLGEALLRVYPTDAHLVTYVVRGATRQPRINKGGLASFPGIVETHAFFCDVDNAGQAPWTGASPVCITRPSAATPTAGGRFLLTSPRRSEPFSRSEGGGAGTT